MKRQSRPFLVEVKKRRSPTQSPAAGLDVAVQERTAPATRDDMERHSSLSYEEALRAADRVFGGRLAREAEPPVRPVEDDARERLFRKAVAPVEEAPAPKQPRILPSLVEEVSPAIPPLDKPPARKRGRPRKVRPEEAVEMGATAGLAEPATPYEAPRPAKRAPGPRRQATVAAEPDRQATASPGPKVAAAAASAAPRARRPAGPHAPGERWKRRLRHLR